MSIKRLYVDVETTVAPLNEIVELSYVYTDNDQIIKTYSAKIEHKEPITAKGYEIHGVADYMCDTPVSDVIKELMVVLVFAKQIIAHNASFDISRLRAWNNKAVNDLIQEKEIVCTMKTYTSLWKTIYGGEPRRLSKAYSSMYDCESHLINNGMTEEQIKEGFKRHFPDQPARHHSSAYDTYLVFLIDRYMRNASKV